MNDLEKNGLLSNNLLFSCSYDETSNHLLCTLKIIEIEDIFIPFYLQISNKSKFHHQITCI